MVRGLMKDMLLGVCGTSFIPGFLKRVGVSDGMSGSGIKVYCDKE